MLVCLAALAMVIIGDVPGEISLAASFRAPKVSPLDSFETLRWEEARVRPQWELPKITLPECASYTEQNKIKGCWNPGDIQKKVCQDISAAVKSDTDKIASDVNKVCTDVGGFFTGVVDDVFGEGLCANSIKGDLCDKVKQLVLGGVGGLTGACTGSVDFIAKGVEAITDVANQACAAVSSIWKPMPSGLDVSWGLGLQIKHSLPAVLKIDEQVFKLLFYMGTGNITTAEAKKAELAEVTFGAVDISSSEVPGAPNTFEGSGAWHGKVDFTVDMFEAFDFSATLASDLFDNIFNLGEAISFHIESTELNIAAAATLLAQGSYDGGGGSYGGDGSSY
jgi:hypothetical protein